LPPLLVDAALLGRSSWTDDDLQTAWRHHAETLDSAAFPRFRQVAPTRRI
jgi:hypothetical protein